MMLLQNMMRRCQNTLSLLLPLEHIRKIIREFLLIKTFCCVFFIVRGIMGFWIMNSS